VVARPTKAPQPNLAISTSSECRLQRSSTTWYTHTTAYGLYQNSGVIILLHMARIQTYGKGGKRKIRSDFYFSSPEKPKESSTGARSFDVTHDFEKLNIQYTKYTKDRERPLVSEKSSVLCGKDANATIRKFPRKSGSSELESCKNGQPHSSSAENTGQKFTKPIGGQSDVPGFHDCGGLDSASGVHKTGEQRSVLSISRLDKTPAKDADPRSTTGPVNVMKINTLLQYLPEPVLRQFGYQDDQSVPHLAITPRREGSPSNVEKDYVSRLNVPEDMSSLAEYADAVLPFADYAASLTSFDLTKIAEASYSEVYRLTTKCGAKSTTVHGKSSYPTPSPSRSPSPAQASSEAVLKLIPLKSPRTTSRPSARTKEDNSQYFMSSAESVLSEVQLLRLMTPIPGFTLFRSLTLLQGPPPDPFVGAYARHRKVRTAQIKAQTDACEFSSAYARAKEFEYRLISEFQFPDISESDSYDAQQWFALLEMDDAGPDLETIEFADVFGVWDVFWNVAIAIGKGEADMEFEHRDLHAGNICVQMPEKHDRDRHNNINSDSTSVACLRDVDLDATKLGFTGIKTTVIDYTQSRAVLSSLPDTVAFKDLNQDLEVFESSSEAAYQYDIPRYMRDLVLKERTGKKAVLSATLKKRTAMRKEEKAGKVDWREWHPRTNLLWLQFLLTELLGWTEEARRNAREKLSHASLAGTQSRYSRIRGAVQAKWSQDGSSERMLKKAVELDDVLLKVHDMLTPKTLLQSPLESAAGLVELAVHIGWMDVHDVLKCD
jgi:serine/threonine-protein kinase haspin